MKRVIIHLAILLLFASINGCGKSDNKVTDDKSSGQNTNPESGEVIVVQLPTIQCGMCKKNIENAVKKIDGVNEVKVVVKDKIANINFDKSKTDLNTIEGAIVMAGYKANDKPADKEAYDKLEDCCKEGGHDK